MITQPLLQEMALQALEALRKLDYELAVTIADEILESSPDHAVAYAVRFSGFFNSKQFERARKIGGRAAELNPNSEFILNNQACLQLEAKQPAAASGLLKTLIEKHGKKTQWLYNLALAQRMVGNYEYAIDTFHQTLDLDPEHDKAAYQLADCLNFVGQPKEATRAFEFVRLLRSKHAPSHSNYIHYATISNGLTPAALRQELDLWNDRFIPKKTRYTPRAISNTKRLKIGFVIDLLPRFWFKQLVAPVINQLAKNGDAVFAYTHDERIMVNKIDENVRLVNVESMSDANFAKTVRSDNIDVIVDVCGMRKSCRQRAFGLQLASNQFAWLGHEGAFATPLLHSLDERLGDYRFFIDESKKAEHTSFPSKTLSGIGCKNGLSDAVLSNWAYILHELDNWKLHLDITEKSAQLSIKNRFKDWGVQADQLLFDSALAPQKGSIALDNFTYNDPIAVNLAVCSGACVVATKEALFPAQQTAAMFTQLGLEDTLSNTPMDYAKRAIALARGLKNPAIMTPEQLKQSGIHDLERFVKHFRETVLDYQSPTAV